MTTPATTKTPTLNQRAHSILEDRVRLKNEGWKFRDYADGRWAASHKARGLKTAKHDSLVETIQEATRLAAERTAEVEQAPVEAGTPAAEAEMRQQQELYSPAGVKADDSNMAFPVPEPGDFESEEFIEAPALVDIAQELIARFEELSFLYDFRLRLFWKSKGGSTGSKNTLGKCVKPSGLLKKYSDADFIVWVAADHTRHRLTNRQMEALLYHELSHCVLDEKGRPAIRPHDFEGFAREIEIYGAWKGDIERIGKAFSAHSEQGSLFH